MYITIILIAAIIFLVIQSKFPDIKFVELLFCCIVFILGFYFIYKNPIIERFENSNENEQGIFHDRCPTTLIQKGSEFYLHNSNIAKIPGVNPLKFENLTEYVEFMEWQRGQGIKCPILYLQETYDAQGNRVYKARKDPTDLNGGLPDFDVNGRYPDPDPGNSEHGRALLLDAGVDDQPFNHNSFPGYDPDNQYIGLETPLDKLYNENNNVSPSLSNKSRNEEIFKPLK
tara:strand:- start:576 stop:1262 length:687 start_codon:yes stop_codon:yes gene_type:complete